MSGVPDEVEVITVLIVEDEYFMGLGLQTALQKFQHQVAIIGQADNFTQAIELVRVHAPNVVLLDLRIPLRSGIYNEPEVKFGIMAIREIRKASLQTRILILSGQDVNREPEIVFDAFRAGAHGYIAKLDRFKPEDLLETIIKVLHGEAIYGPTIARLMLQYHLQPGSRPQSPLGRLTKREQEVLELLAEGKHNKEIATTLVIAETTVKTHVASILSKLHLESSAEVKWFLRYQHGADS